MDHFKHFDANHDGRISHAEWAKGLSTHQLVSESELHQLKKAHGILQSLKDRYDKIDKVMEHRPIELETAAAVLGAVISALVAVP